MTVVAPIINKDTQEYNDTERLIYVFSQTFYAKYNTRLVRGNDEPVYLPEDEKCNYHRIVFAHGFFASALHEIAHWCLAGEKRRQQIDYGYWYCPDGRNEEQQREFEQVEIKPQAIEKALTLACGRAFDVSTDNLNGAEPNRERFRYEVERQYQRYCKTGFGQRVEMILDALSRNFGGMNLRQQQQAVNHHE